MLSASDRSLTALRVMREMAWHEGPKVSIVILCHAPLHKALFTLSDKAVLLIVLLGAMGRNTTSM